MKRITAVLLACLLALSPVAGVAETLARGSRGDEVKQLQDKLNSLGYRLGTADGDFGKKTEGALMDFQGDNALEATGTLTDDTRKWLFSDGIGDIPAPRGAFAIRAGGFEADMTIHRYSYVLSDCTWEQANARAVEMGGHLASIDSFGEYSEILSEIHELGAFDVRFWIGVRREYELGFFMVDTDGMLYVDPIDFGTLMGGYNPWALGCPTYKDGEGNQQFYIRMRFSEGEQRWVWEDTVGEPEAGARNGYIVEYDEPSVLAALAEADVDGVPALSLMTEPSFDETVPDHYDIEVLGLEGRSVLARVTTVEGCWAEFYFTDLNKKEIFWINTRIDGGLDNRLVRATLSEEDYNSLPRNFNIEGVLYAYDRATKKSTDYTDWVTCSLYRSGDNGKTPVRERRRSAAVTSEPEVYRVTITTAANPNGGDPNALIEIYDADGNLIATVHPGDTIYLKPGDYVLKDPNDPNADTPFTVADGPVVVELQDAPLYTVSGLAVNKSTGAALPGATVQLEARGYARTTKAGSDGAYRFDNVPGVDVRITIISDEEQGYQPNHTDLHVDERSEDVNIAAEPEVLSVIYAYLHDGWDEIPEYSGDGSGLSEVMYFTIESDTANRYPSGTILDLDYGGDPPVAGHAANLNSNLEYLNLDPSVLDGVLLKMTGYIHPDIFEAQYPGYDYYFNGWSDLSIYVEKVEPAE